MAEEGNLIPDYQDNGTGGYRRGPGFCQRFTVRLDLLAVLSRGHLKEKGYEAQVNNEAQDII